MLQAMRKLLLLVVVASFAAGFYFDRWQHRPIVLILKSAAHPAQEVVAPKDPRSPVYWEGGGGRLSPSNFSCVQSLAQCWWET